MTEVTEMAQEMLEALQPFFAAAKMGVATYEAVRAANLHQQGLSTYSTVYCSAGVHAAESRISYADWERLAEVAKAIDARRAKTEGLGPKDESAVHEVNLPKSRKGNSND